MIHMRVLDLCGEWTLQRAGEGDLIQAMVPGSVHLDLLRNKLIPDPFFRDNEARLKWIGESEWIYSREFDVAPDLLKADEVLLCFDGLDTLATIRLNGERLAATDNMFRRFEFPVAGLLRPGRNEIEVRLASATVYTRGRQKERNLPGWMGVCNDHSAPQWLRKQQCNFGWDWGPILVTAGIWRPVKILTIERGRISDVRISQNHRDGVVDLACSITTEWFGESQRGSVSIDVILNQQSVARSDAPMSNDKAELHLPVDSPQLWYPNGLGEQPLYTVTVELRDEAGNLLDSWTRRIGLRTLTLDRRPDEWGESFHFAVNGQPFFAKGANWIPADAIVGRATDEDFRRLLTAAADANMNMIRVWGGGNFEDDAFYDLCDELGLCVWQDFLFGCATYPTFDPAFIENVKIEARENVRRLRHHPSIALWCGNNELEMGLVADEWTDTAMSWADYTPLFDEILPEICRELDPQRPYWPSSPHTPPPNRTDFNNPDVGDAHLWSVWHQRKPFEWYRTSTHRFCSEFGFQSFPEPATVASFTDPEDRNITSYVMEHHQRSPIGNATIIAYMLDWFRMPSSFESTLWLSQILQGLAIKYAVEHWRRLMPRCMGALYWQLNDVWPGASWSSIDYFGRWKALHYFAKRFFAPHLLSLVEDTKNGNVDIHVTSDVEQAEPATIRWSLWKTTGECVESGTIEAKLRTGSCKATTLALGKFIDSEGPRNLLFHAELRAADGSLLSGNTAHFVRPKHLELKPPGLKTSVAQTGEGVYTVTVSADFPALYCWLRLVGDPDARWSDNFLHVFPGTPVEVSLRPSAEWDENRIREALVVQSLADTW